MSLQRAVFLAENGIVVPSDASSARDGRGARLLLGAGPGLRLLRDAGFAFHVFGNRPCVALGECNEDELTVVAQHLEALLEDEGVGLTGCSFCPHDPRGVRRDYAVDCLCRLPRPGLLQRAAREHGIDLERSWLIGDSLDEIEAGVRVGCRTVLLDDGREQEWRLSELRLPHHVAEGLGEAALLILEDEHVLDWRRRATAASGPGAQRG